MTIEKSVIKLASGQCAYPSNWIYVPNPFDGEANWIVVVEARNYEVYNVPHFIIPVPKKELSEEDCDVVIDACCDIYPELNSILTQQIAPPSIDPADPAYWEKVKQHLESPYLGLFSVVATDDVFYNPHDSYPFGVVIDRDSNG